MKFRRSPHFKECFANLTKEEQDSAKAAFQLLQAEPSPPYHNSLRIKKMQVWPGIWEGHVTRSIVFTFQYYEDPNTGEKVMFFRKIGRHDAVYNSP